MITAINTTGKVHMYWKGKAPRYLILPFVAFTEPLHQAIINFPSTSLSPHASSFVLLYLHDAFHVLSYTPHDTLLSYQCHELVPPHSNRDGQKLTPSRRPLHSSVHTLTSHMPFPPRDTPARQPSRCSSGDHLTPSLLNRVQFADRRMTYKLDCSPGPPQSNKAGQKLTPYRRPIHASAHTPRHIGRMKIGWLPGPAPEAISVIAGLRLLRSLGRAAVCHRAYRLVHLPRPKPFASLAPFPSACRSSSLT